MIVLDGAKTRRLLPFDRLIPALARMFTQGCDVPLRHTHRVRAGDAAEGTVLLMPAWSGGYFGVKTVCIYPDNSARGLPSVHGSYTLYDARTGVPLAQIDGTELTARRTAAASALAASRLARTDASAMCIVGAGRIGSVLAHAYRAVRPIRSVAVWTRNPASAASVVQQLRSDGFDARAVSDLRAAIADADIVSCATPSSQPLVHGAWLHPGIHLDLIGSFRPDMREADDDCFARASVFIDTTEALTKAGDLLTPLERGVLCEADVRASLEDLCRGRHRGRERADEITLFKSVGTALEDLAAGVLAYETAAGIAPGEE